MNTSRIKNIFIIMLLCVNLFFLFNYLSLKEESENFRSEEIKEAVALLNSKGIKIKADVIPSTKKIQNIYRISSKPSLFDDFARNFFGHSAEAFTTPEGLSYSSGTGNLIVRNNRSFLYLANSFSMNDYIGAINSIQNETLDDEYKKKHINLIYDIFSFGGIEPKNDFERLGHFSKDGVDYYLFIQKTDGITVYSSEITVAIKDDSAIGASGNFICLPPDGDYTCDYHDAINILFNIDIPEKEITEMTLVYYPINHEGESFLLLPSYKLTFEDNSHAVYDAAGVIQR